VGYLLKRAGIWLALMFTACGCEAKHPVKYSTCERACARWAALGCIEGEPYEGFTCVDVCERSLAYEPLPLVCIEKAETCEEARACE